MDTNKFNILHTMSYQEAWKIILGALESTYDDSIKEALFLLAEAASKQDELEEIRKASLDQMME